MQFGRLPFYQLIFKKKPKKMSHIKIETIEKVTSSSNILEVIKDYVDLKKSGSEWKGLSPFTNENSPSFHYSPSKGIWKDFSSGKGGNNAISFIMEIENISFPEAVKILADKNSIDIEFDDNISTKKYHIERENINRLWPIMDIAISKYEENFQKLPSDHPAKIEIYYKRKYTPEIVQDYRIGYASFDNSIYNLCSEKGLLNEAYELGLVDKKTLKDKWINRVIFPLISKDRDVSMPIGIAGRRVGESNKYPKWINSSSSEIYKKDEFWYGLDNARRDIISKNEVWIVEGYNDVIAWQSNGILNTVAACGTAISNNQIKKLKSICDKVIFCFDPDVAGKKAMHKYIPEFIKNNLRVQIVELYPNVDPDEFIRYWSTNNSAPDISDLNSNPDFRIDGFRFLMEERFKDKDDVDIAKEAKQLALVIKTIDDVAMQGIYTDWLSKESKIKPAQIKSYLKSTELKEKLISANNDDFYRLPKGVREPLSELKPNIEKYQLFLSNNQIWILSKDGPPYSFKSVSNFSIEIIQHMQDEKFPMKLVRLKNIHGLERVFDMQSSEMNSLTSFENAVTAHGNFRWKGSKLDHELLKTYLFDNMGTGPKIDVLGWQPEGIWVWNNKVSDPDGDPISIDKNGVFKKDGVTYYVPSANNIYRSNLYKYEAQKKVKSIEASVSFQNYTTQLLKVHRQHGMTAILFSIASIFQDIVVSELNMFPMLFLFGPASSGKDQMADVCQSFFGNPQTAINLEGGVSTIKAQVREFAQFSNTISQLSEYKNGDAKLDGVLKGLWDRRGYKRGNLDSHVGTESIPILSAVLMTGNYAPDQEALVTRFIWEFMDKTIFSADEISEYERLNDMTKNGISSFTDQLLKHRKSVKDDFKLTFREFQTTLKQRRPDAVSRMLSNLSVLGSFYQLFKDIMSFPFTFEEMITHFEKTIDKQMSKLSSASIMNRWWDCFLASTRGSLSDQLCNGRDFKISGNELYFNFNSCYNRISIQWFTQYKDVAPSKGEMMDKIKNDPTWIKQVKAVRMAPGSKSKSTSAYVVNINELPIIEDLKFAIDFQTNDSSIYSDPIIKEEVVKEKNKYFTDDLDF